MTFLDLMLAMEYISISLCKLLLLMMKKMVHGAGIKFATWFYAMHRAFHRKPALATICNPSFASLSKNDCVAAAVDDIEDKIFWNAIYCLLHAIFPALKALRCCNSNILAMDNIFSW